MQIWWAGHDSVYREHSTDLVELEIFDCTAYYMPMMPTSCDDAVGKPSMHLPHSAVSCPLRPHGGKALMA